MKSVLQLLLIAIPAFVGVVIAAQHSPVYSTIKEQERMRAIVYLQSVYPNYQTPELQEIMEKYGITEDEINPAKAFDGMVGVFE